MTAEEFRKYILDKTADKNYGICPPPINAQEGLNILIDHFLGDNWYVALSVNQEQVNTEAIYQILGSYPKKKSLKDKVKYFLKKKK